MAEEKTLKNDNRSICLIDNYQLNFPTDRNESTEKIVQDNFPNIELKTIHYSQLDCSQLKNISGYIHS